jgi:hypothetical protein
MAFKDEQSINAPYPILVTLSGIATEVKEEQPLNALNPILVTLSAIVTEDSLFIPKHK